MGELVAAMCWPVDTTGLPEEINGIQRPEPRFDDTLTTCLGCGREVWIGPKQLEAVNAGVAGPCCFWCTVALKERHPGMATEVLNPGRVEHPRTIR
jgi:hypothetical protein